MDAIRTEYGFRRAQTVETKVERPPRQPRRARRFVITVPEHLAEDFGIAPEQVPAPTYIIHCMRRPLPRLHPSEGEA